MPDFNVKKLVKEAGSTLSRVVQVNFPVVICSFLTFKVNYLLIISILLSLLFGVIECWFFEDHKNNE